MSATQPVLWVSNLSLSRGYRALLSGLSFEVCPGELWQLVGPNGSGKTTLLRALAGLARIGVSGQIKRPPRFLYQGHAPGLKGLLTPKENLSAHPGGHLSSDEGAISDALSAVGLAGFGQVPVARLSAGQQRRVGLARLWLNESPLWLLDEPFTAIDAEGTRLLEAQLQAHCRSGGAVVFTSHKENQLGEELAVLDLCDYGPR